MSQSKHVVILTSVHDPFDPRVFHRQARTLAAAGYRVTLLAPHAADTSAGGVRVRGVPPPRSRAGRPLVWLRLLGRALRARADVYHLHDPELLPLGLLLARATGRPVVYDAHEYYRHEVATRPWIPAPLRPAAAATVHAVETFVARRLAAVVAVNAHMAAGFRARGARAVAVHNYPPSVYLSAVPPATVRPPVVAYVGVLTRPRGLDTLWYAGRALRRRAPAAEVRVIGRVDWVGMPPDIPRDPAAWRAEAATSFVGTIPAEQVPAALAGVAVGWIPFHPTPNQTPGLPLKLLEYMAAGLPVVVSDFGAMAALVREAACGLCVPADDPEAHAEALARLLADPSAARSMGARGRGAVERRYSWEAEAARLLALYAELVSTSGATR
jgi:glycosyltransferase involved in cell wall biosynthesis